MQRVDNILNNNIYNQCMAQIEKAEEKRRFCLHDLEHSLAVARIAYIINLEEGLGFDKECIYAMALLHDIGRCEEYENGTPHHMAGSRIAEKILRASSFTEEEIYFITQAIESHKIISDDADKADLRYILYRADKLSRNCFECKMYDECYWDEEKKNQTVQM
ncbi:MAG: HD domain-containing protein [Lachnospiraceae bacterium]|nr:HD domain-containing protein [Lachnospiraceae bacterium]